MKPDRRDGWKPLRSLMIATVLALLVAAPALAATLFGGKGYVHRVDQARQVVVIDGTEYAFDVVTRFLDAAGTRTTASILKNPKLFNGLQGAMIDPMAVKFEARETSGMPMLTLVEVLPGHID